MRRAILAAFWSDVPDSTRTKTLDRDQLHTYFDYYNEQWELYLHEGGQHVAVRNHLEMIQIVRALQKDMKRHELTATVGSIVESTMPLEEEISRRSVDLAVRLFMMVKCGDVPNSLTSGSTVYWRNGTLRQFLHKYIGDPPILDSSGLKLSRMFNALNLVRIGGLKIVWTTNIIDHLRVIEDDEQVEVFSHTEFLRYHESR
jgi:hypothetical protein